MMRWCSFAAFGFVSIFCASCGPTAPSGPVLPPPLSGYVDDTAFQPVMGAKVEVLDGLQAGAFAITDAQGQFSVNAAIGPTSTFRATKEGYQPATQTLGAPPLTLFLSTDQPSGNAATLTVEADPICTDLPIAARERVYRASVTGNSSSTPPNTTFFINLSGESLDTYFHFVFLEVRNGVVTFDLSDNGIEEEIAPEAYLFVGGVGSVRPSPSPPSISVRLTSGKIDYCVVPSDPGTSYPCTDMAIMRVQCRGANNRLTLTWN